MKELSLNLLDIVQNSIKAGAANIDIDIEENDEYLTFIVNDDGCGMDESMLARVSDPYTTTRTTRKVGLGISLLKMAAEQSGGSVHITSAPGKGTRLRASFEQHHLDRPPLGDIVATIVTLIQGAPFLDFRYSHTFPDGRRASLDTSEIRQALDGVPLSEPGVLQWIAESLAEEEAGEGLQNT